MVVDRATPRLYKKIETMRKYVKEDIEKKKNLKLKLSSNDKSCLNLCFKKCRNRKNVYQHNDDQNEIDRG